jgi:DNA-binding XRE family transcriptional regulator
MLKRCRKTRGIRQQDLARLAHVAQADIVSFEKGRRLPSIGQAKRIALVLGLKVEALFTEGFREQSKHTGRPIRNHMPPPEPSPPPLQSNPHEIYVLCWKCRTRICLKMETSRRLQREDPVCPSCGAELKVMDDQASKAVG